MNLFSIDFSHAELNFLRQALETIPIQGKDAKFCAHIQVKLEHELEEIVRIIKSEEENKNITLQQILETEEVKSIRKK
jgi:hypothetical protein